MNGVLKADVGGVARSLRVELALAPKLEAATGLGIVTLARQLKDYACTTSVVCEVLREALAANGANYTSAEVFAMIEADGLLPSYKTAGLIVVELFSAPDAKRAGKKGPATSGPNPVTPSH